MLRSIHLTKFRAFADFTITFGDGAFLVGPNNAGKSTILTAIRTADALLRYSYQRRADRTLTDAGRSIVGYPLILTEFPALAESVRHEFGIEESRFEVNWKSGSRLVAVWPEDDGAEREPFFYLESRPGMYVRTPAQTRAAFPQIGTIPILTPVDNSERVLSDSYVKQSVSTRLSSRHFRNQLYLLRASGALDGFIDWAGPWMAEVEFDELKTHLEPDGLMLDLFIREAGSRVPKELVWVGDGVQVWLQLLYHVYRVATRDTIVLDEPEVYLHPDLQRRLVHLLESTGKQVILATHSSEMVAEADPTLVTLIDKSSRRAKRVDDPAKLEALTATLGTAFNLRLAKALRSKVALFVEGDDLSLLKRIARTLELTSVASEQGVTVISLKGYSRWGHVAPFTWLTREMLPGALKTFVILDRDYRCDAECEEVQQGLRDSGVEGHIWARKELESYLLTPAVLARLSGHSLAGVNADLSEITDAMQDEVFGRLLDERVRIEVAESRHRVDVITDFKAEFDKNWADPGFRLAVCPPKKVLARLNSRLQASGMKGVGFTALARSHRADEVDPEMVKILTEVDAASS